MANDINRVFLIGRLTKDPDLRYTQGGTSVASFSIANNRTYTSQNERKEAVSYFNCIAWGKSGEVIAQYCKKGQRIGIEGRLQQRSWQDSSGQKRNTVEVVVENFQFLDAKGKDSGDNMQPQSQLQGQQSQDEQVPPPSQLYSPDDSSGHFSDDDIPF
jgi:single-strand DNA-binding protein